MSHDPSSGQPWNPSEGQSPPAGQNGTPGQYGVPPGSYGVPPGSYGPAPSAYRAWAITCVVCGVLFSLILGMPCGLAALSNSRRVQSASAAGDQQAAARASRRARNWAIASTVLDALGVIVLISLLSHGNASTT